MRTTLELVDLLAEALNSKELAYCHWKSNFALEHALSGETDLDLLLDRSTLPQAVAILMDLGFKPATVTWGPATPPGIYHYYGLDAQTGRLVHVHLFSSVFTGESFIKSHLFPFETMLLENTENIDRIRVASKPAELVLFILRIYIKYGSLLDLPYLLRDSENLRRELLWLQGSHGISSALRLLEKYCPVVDERLFVMCVDTLNGHNSLVKNLILARRVRRRLRIYARDSAVKRVLCYVRLLSGYVWRRLRRRSRNKMLQTGGAVIAFIGPEATGKSTLVTECKAWLGTVFMVRSVHAGKPPSSWLTVPINKILPLTRRLVPQFRSTHLGGYHLSRNTNQAESKLQGFAGPIYALRAVILAWDRRCVLVRARRLATNGEIAICDRYPSDAVGAMDSPRLHEDPINGGLSASICNWLARLEQYLYKQIPPPDIALRLRVSVATAKKRNRERIKPGKETDAYLVARHRQSQDWHLAGVKYIFDIDTEGSLQETILRVKKAVWKVL